MNNLSKIVEAVQLADGGATIDKNGKEAKGLYFASCYPEFSMVEEANKVTEKTIQDYVNTINKKSGGLLDKKGFYLGLWNDPKTNLVYFDISQAFDDRKQVEQACKEHKQLAYFDTTTGKSVRVA